MTEVLSHRDLRFAYSLKTWKECIYKNESITKKDVSYVGDGDSIIRNCSISERGES